MWKAGIISEMMDSTLLKSFVGSLIYNKNNKGPKAEPCWTPRWKVLVSDRKPEIQINCFLCVRKKRNNLFPRLLIPYSDTCVRSISWSSVSDEFCRSTKKNHRHKAHYHGHSWLFRWQLLMHVQLNDWL